MITIDQLSVRYGTIHALHTISAQLQRGKITAIIGPNAAGKSTLLRCIIGGQQPTTGSVQIDGETAHKVSAKTLARKMAYVAQRPMVSAAFTVREVVAFGRYAIGPDAQAVERAMRQVEVEHLAERIVPTLSAGQQQRVAVARALAQLQPNSVLVLDEPTSAMDLQHGLACMNIARELANNGATIVVSLHDLSLAVDVADDVVLLNEGRLVAHGPVETVMTPSQLATVFGVEFEWLERPSGRRVLLPIR